MWIQLFVGENANAEVNNNRKSIKQSNQKPSLLLFHRFCLRLFIASSWTQESSNYHHPYFYGYLYFLQKKKRICKISIYASIQISCRPLYSWNVRIFCQMFQTWSLKTFNAYLTQIYWISDIVLDTKTCNQDFSLMVFRMIALNIRSTKLWISLFNSVFVSLRF